MFEVLHRIKVKELPCGGTHEITRDSGGLSLFWALFLSSLIIFVNIVHAEQKSEVFVQLGHQFMVSSVTFSPDGRYALSGGSDGTLKLWEISTGKEVRTLAGHAGYVNSVAFSPDGRYALSGGDITLELWEISTGKKLRAFAGHARAVISVAFFPDGRYGVGVQSVQKVTV